MFLAPAHASETPCKTELPIDTAKKAWCAADRVFYVQSCFSVVGFSRQSKDLGDRWLLASKDKNSNGGCGTIAVEVCKKDGKIIYNAGTKNCDS